MRNAAQMIVELHLQSFAASERLSRSFKVTVSHRSTAAAACGWFAAERPEGGRYRAAGAGDA